MSIEFIIYLLDVVPRYAEAVSVISLICFIPSTIGWVVIGLASIEEPDDEKAIGLKKLCKKITITSLIILALVGLVPSKQGLYTIAGASVLKESNIPQKVLVIINEKLDQYSEELKKEK